MQSSSLVSRPPALHHRAFSDSRYYTPQLAIPLELKWLHERYARELKLELTQHDKTRASRADVFAMDVLSHARKMRKRGLRNRHPPQAAKIWRPLDRRWDREAHTIPQLRFGSTEGGRNRVPRSAE